MMPPLSHRARASLVPVVVEGSGVVGSSKGHQIFLTSFWTFSGVVTGLQTSLGTGMHSRTLSSLGDILVTVWHSCLGTRWQRSLGTSVIS